MIDLLVCAGVATLVILGAIFLFVLTVTCADIACWAFYDTTLPDVLAKRRARRGRTAWTP